MNYERLPFLVIGIAAFFGNMLTVILFLRKRKWLKKAHNCLIFGLAIQDIFVAICLVVMPGFFFEHDKYKPPEKEKLRALFCKVVWSHYIPFSLGITSVYTCLMLTFDRWLAVVKPLSYKKCERSVYVVVFMVTFPWIAGFFLEITALVNAAPSQVNGTFSCSWENTTSSPKTVSLAIISFFGMIVIPAGLMVLLYSRVIVHLKRSSNRVSVMVNDGVAKQTLSAMRSLKRVTLTAFIASTIVVICWLPDQLYYALSQVEVAELGTTAHSLVKILAFANSCANPVIYCFSNSEYRKSLKQIFCFCCVKKRVLASEFSLTRQNTS